MKNFWRYLGFSTLTILIVIIIGFVIWAANPAQPEDLAINSLNPNQNVQYQDKNNWLVFQPRDSDTKTGLVLYPGGRVDYRAYAPAARQIAEEGFTVIVVPMPLNFAFLGIERAAEVIAAFPTIDHWAIGGHSLGGAMAAEFAKSNPMKIEGLILWASYPGENTDLSGSNLIVTSIYATNDGLATLEEITDSRARLPEETHFVEVQGGNHAGFGWYGSQNGDGVAEISKSQQQSLIVDSTIDLLKSLRD